MIQESINKDTKGYWQSSKSGKIMNISVCVISKTKILDQAVKCVSCGVIDPRNFCLRVNER